MFKKALKHWGSAQFEPSFTQAFALVKLVDLPLQNCCQHFGFIDETSIKVMILSKQNHAHKVCLKIVVLFVETIAGCACSDDPEQTTSTENGYCELQMSIDKRDAHATFSTIL